MMSANLPWPLKLNTEHRFCSVHINNHFFPNIVCVLSSCFCTEIKKTLESLWRRHYRSYWLCISVNLVVLDTYPFRHIHILTCDQWWCGKILLVVGGGGNEAKIGPIISLICVKTIFVARHYLAPSPQPLSHLQALCVCMFMIVDRLAFNQYSTSITVTISLKHTWLSYQQVWKSTLPQLSFGYSILYFLGRRRLEVTWNPHPNPLALTPIILTDRSPWSPPPPPPFAESN